MWYLWNEIGEGGWKDNVMETLKAKINEKYK